MKIQVPRSYVYSDQAADYLKRKGFKIEYLKNFSDDSSRSFLIPLIDEKSQATCLEYCEVLDEDLFVQNSKSLMGLGPQQRHLEPEIRELEFSDLKSVEHENSVYQLSSCIFKKNFKNEPWQTFLNISKAWSLAAVHLKCHNFQTCEQISGGFDRYYDFNGKAYGLIHMGSTSFDLLISE